MRFPVSIILLASAVLSASVRAELNIEITGSDQGASPIAIVPFGWKGSGPRPAVDVAEVIGSDLERSGQFRTVPVDSMLAQPHSGPEVKFENWRILDVENLVVGSVEQNTAGQYIVKVQLFDVYKSRQLVGKESQIPASELRSEAHLIADIIYEALTGERGAFNTRIAYVVAQKQGDRMQYSLEIADTDGHDARTILRSRQPIMSPTWSPDGRQVAYVSFEHRRSEVFIHDVSRGTREAVASFDGINGAPVWSPDGRRLALTSSHKGNPDIYLLDLNSKNLRRLTDDWSIDTEPSWLPDGRSLIFTSGRSGSPQLYRLEVGSGRVERLTFEGRYNASPDVSPDGKTVAMVHGEDGQYRIGALDLKTGLFRLLTDGRLDESPSFAPNGAMVLYASQSGGRGVLSAVSIDGRTRQRLASSDGDVREPTWGPFPEKQR